MVAEQQCPSLLSKAKDIQTKFKQTFILFKKCHDIYDSNKVTEDQVTQLGKQIYRRARSTRLHLLPFREPHHGVHVLLQGEVSRSDSFAENAHA